MRRSGRPWLAATALGAVVLAVLALPASAAKDDLDLVSRATDGAAANAGSFGTDISADGRFVALVSFATNLSDADQDLVIDAFLRDMATGTTTLISRATGPAGAGGDDRTFIARVSGDGRYVAFDSSATNLSAIDDDTMADVFRRDTVDRRDDPRHAARTARTGRRPPAPPRRSRPTAGSSPSSRRTTPSRGSATRRCCTCSCATWTPGPRRSSAAPPASARRRRTPARSSRSWRPTAGSSPSSRTRTTSPPRPSRPTGTSSCGTWSRTRPRSSAAPTDPRGPRATAAPLTRPSRRTAASSPSAPSRRTCRPTIGTRWRTSSCATRSPGRRRW